MELLKAAWKVVVKEWRKADNSAVKSVLTKADCLVFLKEKI